MIDVDSDFPESNILAHKIHSVYLDNARKLKCEIMTEEQASRMARFDDFSESGASMFPELRFLLKFMIRKPAIWFLGVKTYATVQTKTLTMECTSAFANPFSKILVNC